MKRWFQFTFYQILSSLFCLVILCACGDPLKELPSSVLKDNHSVATKDHTKDLDLKTAKNVSNAQVPLLPSPAFANSVPVNRKNSIPKDQRVMIVANGQEQYMTEAEALKQGYQILDFRDQWVPNIFKSYANAEEDILEHSYREIFIGLANDKSDNNGQPVEEGEYNFLEVFGIPPSMTVLATRFKREAQETCYQEINYEKIALAKSIRFGSQSRQKKERKKIKIAQRQVEKAMTKHFVDTYEDLLKIKPKYKKKVATLKKYKIIQDAITEIEKRLDCDLHSHPRYRHKKSRLDQGLRLALRRFQRKHKLYEYANLKSDTVTELATPALQANFNSFRRAMEERIIAGAGILEDGTVHRGKKHPTYKSMDGTQKPIRNLVKEFTDKVMKQLELDSSEKVADFFARHPISDFEWLRVGVKYPEYPEYYSDHMEFDIIVDRGDIWYDPPFNNKGKKIKQRRRRLPKFKIYLNYNDQRIQLIHWPTTIGGWRKEIANNGYEYLKYKNSDIGKRVIRKVISGPVWVPPKSTPLKSLAKRRYINGKAQNLVNYEEMGPGYLSAYGLVAGYFVIPGRNGRGDYDRGIRAHGSSDFMSILSPERFSHGCHRLKNDYAVRLYGFLLKHRKHTIHGDQKIKHERNFLYREQVFQVRLLTRGFLFEMTPPIPVEVLEGRVLSKQKKPIEGYVEIPDHEYPSGSPNDPPVTEEKSEGGNSDSSANP
jgi:hypothetical protein